MNLALTYPEIFSGYPANVATQPAAADIHIQLSSNSDFNDAIQQVMHVAELSQTNISRAPMRVEMELQTPPGAIVNVYVSKQSDGWRAQLSASDPAALSWVQDKMSSLPTSNELGIQVKWLPPQLESTTATSTGNDANLSWDRNGQNQQGYQQQSEEQQQPRQQNQNYEPAYATGEDEDFFSTLAAIGRAS